MIAGYIDFPDFFADCKAKGREIMGRDLVDGKWVNIPFGLVAPEQQLQTAFSWWRTGTVPPKWEETTDGRRVQ